MGLPRTCTQDDVKRRYRVLAKEWHPDVCQKPEATEVFKRINDAYHTLYDEDKRKRYDQFGERIGVEGPGAGGPGFEVDLSDIFESFFGGGGGRGGGVGGRGGRRGGPTRGDDLRVDMDIDFKTACFGAEEKVRIRHLEVCTTCSGSGVKPGSKSSTCRQCGGSGVVIQATRTPLGAFQTQTTCPTCRGTGEVVDEYCGTCSGQGRVEQTRSVKVKIPPGVEDGNKLRLKGEGDAGEKGGPSGDLFVYLRVKPHKTFTRQGKDIYSQTTVSYLDAILGNDKVNVEVVDAKVEIKVPAGCQPDTVLRIRGKGAPLITNPKTHGDHYVTIKVDIPKDISGDEKKALTQLRDKKGAKGKGFGGLF
ncbi:unnamed protein product [Choristocarpus tenellus]